MGWATGAWATGAWAGTAWANQGVAAPVQISDIPSIVVLLDSGEHEYDLGQYFSDADSYAIDPALEAGWSFDTNTGLLTIDTDDENEFGPFTVTATNDGGDTDSNEFSITVTDRFLGHLLPTLRHQDETLVHEDGTLRHQRVGMRHRR